MWKKEFNKKQISNLMKYVMSKRAMCTWVNKKQEFDFKNF